MKDIAASDEDAVTGGGAWHRFNMTGRLSLSSGVEMLLHDMAPVNADAPRWRNHSGDSVCVFLWSERPELSADLFARN
jgi:hypothetical protein